jgi:protein required for attachment to host cells
MSAAHSLRAFSRGTMKTDWIVIANATRARVLQQDAHQRVKELHSFEHPASRSKISDLVDSRAGYERTDRSFGAAAYQPRLDAKQKEHQRFARELADYLEQQALAGTYARVEVFASSPFLGELKAELGSATTRLLGATHDLDLTMVGKAELGRRIAQEMAH